MISINKKYILKVILIIWLVAATVYFLLDVFGKYELKKSQEAYVAGYQGAVEDIIKKAQEDTCANFNVQSGDKKVSIVNVDCFKKDSKNDQTGSAQNIQQPVK